MPGHARTAIATISLALLAGCGMSPWWESDPRCDEWIGPTCVVFDAPVPTATPRRLRALRERAEHTWGEPVMVRWRVRFAPVTGCQASETACAFPESREVVIRAGRYAPVLLLHEAGHTLGDLDAQHRDPRWHEVDALMVDACREVDACTDREAEEDTREP